MDYDGLRERYEKVYSGSAKAFPEECAIIERALAFSFSLGPLLRARPDSKEEYLAAFFYRNCVYLSAAYHMARMGMLDPAGNNLRTVFETIIWQYAYLLDDKQFEAFKKIRLMEAAKFSALKSGEWSNTKERALENLRRKFNLQKSMKKLYRKEFYSLLFSSQYWVLSHKSHTSTFGINHNTPTMEGGTTFDKRPEEVLDNLKGILYFCSENLVCFLNCFGAMVGQAQIDRILAQANEVNLAIPPAASLVPESEDLPFRVRARKI